MKTLGELLAEYRQQHTKKSNKIAHYIGIPAIIIGILLLLSWVSISIFARWHISFAWVVVILSLIYYFTLDIKLGIATAIILIILTLICSWIAFPSPNKFNFSLFVILFFGGWIILFIGHGIEKSKPAFMKSLSQLLIAPLFLIIDLLTAIKLDKFFDLDKFEANSTASPDE